VALPQSRVSRPGADVGQKFAFASGIIEAFMKPEQAKPATNHKNRATVSPARRAAFDILRRVESEGSYASALLAALGNLSREDRALAQELTLGVLRQQKLLDYFIERYSRRKIEKLDLAVVLALRLGLYQIRFLSRIPQSAAVNESVNLVKMARKTSAAGMVNAALRNAARHLDEKPGEAITDKSERLAVELSHAPWMLGRWAANFGEAEMHRLAFADNQTPESAFRINTLRAGSEETLARLAAESLQMRASKIAAGAYVIEGGQASGLAPFVEDGSIYIQDEASQLVSLLLDAKAGQRILDMCAAPGSKTTHIAALTENRAQIIACDIHSHRLETLLASCQRLGVTSVETVLLAATEGLPFAEAEKFDRVLIDAPCTGTGTLRRNPEIKWRLGADDIKRLAEIQSILLARGAQWLKPGGRLIYSTCSVEPEENEEVVEKFLAANPEFQLAQVEVPEDCLTAEGFVRTFPHRQGTDGFFAAVLWRP
jgi:16S rRNA (cytosine967-C5)-methyltransferase